MFGDPDETSDADKPDIEQKERTPGLH